MAVETLLPVSTVTGDSTGVPSASNHLNVDDGIAADTIDTADYNHTFASGDVDEYGLGTLANTGTINQIKWATHEKAETQQAVPGAKYQVFLDGVAIVPEKEYNVAQWPNWSTFQIVWNNNEFLTGYEGLTGATWNAATTRTMRRTTSTNVGGSTPPSFENEE